MDKHLLPSFAIVQLDGVQTSFGWKSFKLDTSSTAQGGGGSFKKKKTIGGIGCCESRMSEQKTDQLTN